MGQFRLGLTLFFSFFLLSETCFALVKCSEPFRLKPISETEKLIFDRLPPLMRPLLENDYATERTLNIYLEDLPSLKAILSEFSSSSHWIDLGSGQGLALRDFLKLHDLGHVTGITYTTPKKKINLLTDSSLTPQQMARHTWFEGRFFEDIPTSEIRQADVITDLMGVLAYSLRVDIVLNKTLNLLKPGGTLLFFNADSVQILMPGGKLIYLHEFLKATPGLTVSLENGEIVGGFAVTVSDRSLLRKNPFHFELVSAKMGMPVRRVFRAVNP